MKSVLILLGASLLVIALVAGCGGDSGGTDTKQDGTRTMDGGTGSEEDTGMEKQESFTLAKLAEFDGKDGNPAYVAVDGVVYDVTGSSYWPEGEHTSCDLDAVAGKDLSDLMDQSPPRMRDLIESQPVVGILEE